MRKKWLFALGIALIFSSLILNVRALCPPSGCGGGEDYWERSAQAFINEDVPIVGVTQNMNHETGSFHVGKSVNENANVNFDRSVSKMANDLIDPEYRTDLFLRGEFIKPLASVSSSDVVVDVSSGIFEGKAHIRGAINIPSKSFLSSNGTLKPISEIASILGAAGISRNDALVIYGDTFGSGEAAFVLWLLRYLGHENVKAIDGGLEDWKDASLPLETKVNIRIPTNYSPAIRTELLANYEFVESGVAQLVDARTILEFGKEKIPNAFFISPAQVLEKGKIKPGKDLSQTFAILDRKRPIVVYSNDVFNSSLVWYSLQLMDFDSRIYSWQDWKNHKESKVYMIK